MYRDDDTTSIFFFGGDEGIDVKETPDQIHMLPQLKSA
jgi:hypothetical protein